MAAGFVEQHMAAGDQKQTAVALKEETAGVGQYLPGRQGGDARCAEHQGVDHGHGLLPVCGLVLTTKPGRGSAGRNRRAGLLRRADAAHGLGDRATPWYGHHGAAGSSSLRSSATWRMDRRISAGSTRLAAPSASSLSSG